MSRIPGRTWLLSFIGCAAMAGAMVFASFVPFHAQPNANEQAPNSGDAMNITRINQFPAKPGSGDELYELVSSFLPIIRSSDGCIDARLLRGVDDPDTLVVIEVWRDQDAHRASAKNVPPGTFEKAMALMAGPPSGAYYH